MARHTGPVLLDTNAILECFRVGGWKALSSGYDIQTVENCFTETQTGSHKRTPDKRIDPALLAASFKAVHQVPAIEVAKVALTVQDIQIDPGERALWAHAAARTDGWILCGPDKASMNFGVRLGLRERLVSLEALLKAVGFSPKVPLKGHYTEKWLRDSLSEFAVEEALKGQ